MLFVLRGGYTTLDNFKLESGNEYELRGMYYDFVEKKEKVIINIGNKRGLMVIDKECGYIK